MANWQRKLDLTDVWGKAKNREISARELSGIVADRLEALSDCGVKSIDADKAIMVDEFRLLFEEEWTDFNDFDDALERLYNWADQPFGSECANKKVCWIATNF